MSPVFPWLIVVVWVLHQFGSQTRIYSMVR